MFHTLKDLLPDALRRGKISQEMAATKIVEAFNQWIINFLPNGHKQDAIAISYREKTINIKCRNTAVAHWLIRQEQEIIKTLAQKNPEIPVLKIRTNISLTSPDFF